MILNFDISSAFMSDLMKLLKQFNEDNVMWQYMDTHVDKAVMHCRVWPHTNEQKSRWIHKNELELILTRD